MRQVEQLLHARWVAPLETAAGVQPDLVLPHHSVALENGRIIAVLPSSQARATFTAAEVVELPDHVLLPGLINAHTHAAMSLMRGLADDLPLMDWLNQHIWPTESRWVSDAFCQAGLQLACAEFIRGGVTCFNDMYFCPDVGARVATQAGMRIATGLIVLDAPTMWAKDADEYLHKGMQVRDAWRGHPLVSTVLAPHAPYTISDAPLERIRILADEMDLPVHMHVHETAFEVADAQARTGERPLARLDRLGLLNASFIAVHMTQLTDAEIALCAERGISVVHCPESNLKLASGFCPVAKLAAAGVNLALGTDGAASNNDQSMFGEMNTAALLAKAVAGDASALPAAQALHMATLGGAKALGLEAEIGSLLPGKQADLCAVSLAALNTQPVYDPISQLVYAAHSRQVSDVWVAGRRLLEAGSHQSMDVDSIVGQAQAWAEKIAAAEAQ